MARIFGGALLLWSLCWTGVAGQKPATLAWNFAEGERFFIERNVHMKQTIKGKGKIFNQETTNVWLSSALVEKKTPEGYVLALEIESVVRKLNDVAGKRVIDDKLGEKMKGAKFTITMTKTGKITKLDGYEPFIKKLGEQKAEIEKVLRTLVSEELIRASLEEVFAFMPASAVKPGDDWKRVSQDPVAPFGHFESTYSMVYEGLKAGRHEFAADIAVSFKPSPVEVDLFKVTMGKASAKEGKASYTLDAAGKEMSGKKKVVIQGTLDIEAGGNPSSLELLSETVLTMRVFTKRDNKVQEKIKRKRPTCPGES